MLSLVPLSTVFIPLHHITTVLPRHKPRPLRQISTARRARTAAVHGRRLHSTITGRVITASAIDGSPIGPLSTVANNSCRHVPAIARGNRMLASDRAGLAGTGEPADQARRATAIRGGVLRCPRHALVNKAHKMKGKHRSKYDTTVCSTWVVRNLRCSYLEVEPHNSKTEFSVFI